MGKMDFEDIKNMTVIAGFLFAAVLYVLVFYTIIMCINGNDLKTIVVMNNMNEAWFEILVFPTIGVFIFLGLIFELKRIFEKK